MKRRRHEIKNSAFDPWLPLLNELVTESTDCEYRSKGITLAVRFHGLSILGQALIHFGDPGALGAVNLDQGKFVIVKLGDKRNCPIDKVAEIIEQLGVVLELEVGPLELGILNFRTDIKKVKTPHIGRDFGLSRL